jgi:hypothetical protein
LEFLKVEPLEFLKVEQLVLEKLEKVFLTVVLLEQVSVW